MITNDLFQILVRVIGLEPTRLAAPEPKSGASTNFATPAFKIQIESHIPYQKDIQDSRAKKNFFEKIYSEASHHKFFIKRLFFNQVG